MGLFVWNIGTCPFPEVLTIDDVNAGDLFAFEQLGLDSFGRWLTKLADKDGDFHELGLGALQPMTLCLSHGNALLSAENVHRCCHSR